MVNFFQIFSPSVARDHIIETPVPSKNISYVLNLIGETGWTGIKTPIAIPWCNDQILRNMHINSISPNLNDYFITIR